MDRFLLFDKARGSFLRETPTGFGWANHDATVYEDMLDAEWAMMNCGGDVKIVTVHPIPGVTQGF